MATAWNGRIAAIQANKAPVKIDLEQDQLLRNDCWAIPKGAAEQRERAEVHRLHHDGRARRPGSPPSSRTAS